MRKATVEMVKVNGVQFNNLIEDGGESRQSILEAIFNKTDKKETVVRLIYGNTKKGNSPYVKVQDIVTGNVLGFLPKEVAKQMHAEDKQVKEARAHIDYHGTFHVKVERKQIASSTKSRVLARYAA